MSISLEGAIRTCKVDTSWDNRVQSDRFFNPNNMVCPVWNGMDNTGRSVCPDSFMTKTAGCNSALDRVMVENDQRPQYMEYVTLNSNGFGADLYGNTMTWNDEQYQQRQMNNIHKLTGQFGYVNDWRSTNTQNQTGAGPKPCSTEPYAQAMSQMQQQNRQVQSNVERFNAYKQRNRSGF
jgi:hypothetical protein